MSGNENILLAQAIGSLLTTLSKGVAATGSDVKRQKIKYSTATCPDTQCGTLLYFPSHEASVECSGCGQRHTTSQLTDVHQLTDKEEKSQRHHRSFTEMKSLFGGKKTAELVKVRGISNYQCKLLSPLLTTHGKDRNDKPCLLKDLGLGDVFDCSKLSSRAFAIEESMLDTKGYGEDKSGSLRYLKETLDELSEFNGVSKCLVPIHADGDGHCLVHAISRCLVGRELFWHALRTNMENHLKVNCDWYSDKLKDFCEAEDWSEIISEAGPEYEPPSGQAIGLRTVHIFALANVLRRPIILLDGKTGMQSKGEYSSIFLPSFYKPDECCTNSVPNSPIVIAWSSSGYNHFIPLVPIKDKPLPKLPITLRPKVWCDTDDQLFQYIPVESNGSIVLAKGKPLQESYIQKLVACMDQLFFEKYSVNPSLVADFNQHVYRNAGCVGVSLKTVTMETKLATEEKRLFRCLTCSAITNIPKELLINGGSLYEVACNEFSLQDGQKYTFPTYGITAEYSAPMDSLIPFDVNCFQCGQVARRLLGDGTILYENGDRTLTRADPEYTRCCGFKHYWNGKEYDNQPQPIKITLTWKGISKTVIIYWFQYERDPSLNSNIYDVAYQTVAEHFPGEFGSEQLVQQVVDMIVSATEKKEEGGGGGGGASASTTDDMETETGYNDLNIDSTPITKTIITGMNKQIKTIHKEELGVSETERKIKRKVENKLQQMATASSAESAKFGRKTSPSPSTTDLSSTTPPNKISPTSKSPKSSPPTQMMKDVKRIRVTSSEGKNSNITLSLTATYTDLQLLIEQELGIPVHQQKLRWGFPPKELLPPEDHTSPLPLSHGERVSVERLGGGTSNTELQYPVIPPPTRSEEGDEESVASQLLKDFDSFTILESFPFLFKKGGHCYEELMRSYGHKLKDHSHVQFNEIPNIVFRYSSSKECLEVCLGDDHVPIGPLTIQQKALALINGQQSKHDHNTRVGGEEGGVSEAKWLVNRSSSSGVKAFTGAGRTLGGGGGKREDDSTVQDKQQQQGDGSSYSSALLAAAELITMTRMNDLRSKEKELLNEIQSLNKQLQTNKDNQVAGDTLDLEKRLLEMSSELKELRDEIRELSNL